jgi:prepilin-type N-terminal cleavage/methylation domain-containing protein
MRKTPHGMTLVEMTVALGVACLLMVAVVAFLVNGVVSTSKTTAIDDTTVKGRYVFEHMSKELAQADDLYNTNFVTPGGGSGYAGFNYRISLGGAATTQQAWLSQNYVVVTFNTSGYLAPVAGDFLQLPYPNLGSRHPNHRRDPDGTAGPVPARPLGHSGKPVGPAFHV